MLNDIFKSFFRTLGRILAYLFIGFIISLIFTKFSAEEISIDYGSSSTYLVYTGYINPLGPTGWTIPSTDGNFPIGDSHYFLLGSPGVSDVTTGASRLIDINLTNISIESGKTYRFNLIWEIGNGVELHLDNINNLKCIINNNPNACSNLSMTAEKLTNSSAGNPRWLLSMYLTTNVSGNSIELVINNNSTDTTGTYFFYNGSSSSRGIRLNSVNAFYLTGQDALITSINNSIQETNSKIDNINNNITSDNDDFESSKCGIVCKLKKLPSKFLDGIKSIFIPDNFDFINDFVDSIESKLGFIASIPIQLIEFILNLSTATWEDVTSISFPSISIFGYNFWNSQEVDISTGINLFKPYRYITDVLCVILCCRTLLKWYERFTGGDNK